MVKKGIFVILAVLLILPFVTAQNVGVNIGEPLSLRAGVSTGVVIGDVLVTNVNNSLFWNGLGSPADILLNDLGDVNVPSATDGQVLSFNASGNNWIPVNQTGGGGGSTDLTNVALTNETNNFTEDQLITGDLNVTGNITGNMIFGSMFMHNFDGLVLDIPSINTYVNFTRLGAGEMNGFTFQSNNSLVAEMPGMYKISLYSSLALVSGGKTDFVMSIHINGTEYQSILAHRTHSSTGDVGTYSGSGYVPLNIGDVVTLEIQDIDNPNQDVRYYYVSVTIERLGNIA